MNQSSIEHETWLELSHAASRLGVHSATLRRWADAGKIPCARTPGGRRRFSARALDDFMARCSSQNGDRPADGEAAAGSQAALSRRVSGRISDNLRGQPAEDSLLLRLSEAQRAQLRGTGQRLTALLFQYSSRCDGGEVFLEEGRRIAGEYSRVCRAAGLSIRDTAQVFLFFRRSILGSLYQTAHLGGCDDPEGQRLYARSTDFFDQLLLDLISGYVEASGE